MKKIWNKIGWLVYWFGVPILYVYLKSGKRTRILVSSGDKVLVVKGWIGDDRWILPGGGLHRREKPVDGVLRELFEETNIKLDEKQLKYHGVFEQDADLLHGTYHLFTAKLPEAETPRIKGWEISDTKWVTAKNLSMANSQQHVIDALKQR